MIQQRLPSLVAVSSTKAVPGKLSRIEMSVGEVSSAGPLAAPVRLPSWAQWGSRPSSQASTSMAGKAHSSRCRAGVMCAIERSMRACRLIVPPDFARVARTGLLVAAQLTADRRGRAASDCSNAVYSKTLQAQVREHDTLFGLELLIAAAILHLETSSGDEVLHFKFEAARLSHGVLHAAKAPGCPERKCLNAV